MEKEFGITWEGKEEKVTIKKLSYGERNDCLRKSTVFNPINQTASLDVYTFNEQRLLKALVKAPFKVDLESIRSLAPELGDKIISEIDGMATVNAEVQKN